MNKLAIIQSVLVGFISTKYLSNQDVMCYIPNDRKLQESAEFVNQVCRQLSLYVKPNGSKGGEENVE